MVALADPALLRAIRNVALIGLDTKHDFNKYRFPTLLVSFTDAYNHGAVAALIVLSEETKESCELALRVLQWNVPCSRADCDHPRQLHSCKSGHAAYGPPACLPDVCNAYVQLPYVPLRRQRAMAARFNDRQVPRVQGGAARGGDQPLALPLPRRASEQRQDNDLRRVEHVSGSADTPLQMGAVLNN
jgi:hypothetical protein